MDEQILQQGSQNSGVAPVPPSPEVAPLGMEDAPDFQVNTDSIVAPTEITPGAEEGFVGEEQKQELMGLIEGIREKLGEMRSGRFMSQNATDEIRQGALKEVFAMLRRAGVDLANPASVADFIEQLREQNPAMADQFESAMEMLLDGYTPKNVDVDVSDLMGPMGDGVVEEDPMAGQMVGESEMPPEMPMGAPAPAPMGQGSLNNETPNETLPENMGGPAQAGPLGEIG